MTFLPTNRLYSMTINDEQLAKFAVAIVTAILSMRTDAQVKTGSCTDCGTPLDRSDYADADFIVTQAFATFDIQANIKRWNEIDWDADESEHPAAKEPLLMGAGGPKLVM